MRHLSDVYRRVLLIAAVPVIHERLFAPSTGREYGVGLTHKLRLVVRAFRNTRRIPVLSHAMEHLAMATALLQVPPEVDGCVVECGTYAGGSTANLSLACALVGRELEVFDSFEGLPASASEETVRILGQGEDAYEAGQFSARLDDVRSNVERWGRIDVCHFHKGFFEETLQDFDRPCVLAFIDVDIRSSAETCIRRLWPALAEGCRLYTHEAEELQIAGLFYDEPWWREQMSRPAPGLAGAGSGLGLLPAADAFESELGFTVKPG